MAYILYLLINLCNILCAPFICFNYIRFFTLRQYTIEMNFAPTSVVGAPKQNNVFTRVAGGRAPTRSENPAEGVVIMSTYEELSLIVSIALLIIAILNYTHKK